MAGPRGFLTNFAAQNHSIDLARESIAESIKVLRASERVDTFLGRQRFITPPCTDDWEITDESDRALPRIERPRNGEGATRARSA